jgi:hypothetical protein
MGWFNQHIIDSTNGMWDRIGVNPQEYASTFTFNDGNMYATVTGGDYFGYFDYSPFVSQQQWFHMANVFDGTQSIHADRLKIYINGKLMTLTYSGPIVPSTASATDDVTRIGRYATNNQWLGRITDCRLYQRALSQREIVASMVLSPLEAASEDDAEGKIASAAAQSLIFSRLATLQPLLVR